MTESLRQYFGTKKVKLVITSLAPGAGPTRTFNTLDELVKDVENARVWGGLHYRSTMTETAKDFPRIARDVGKRFFLPRGRRRRGHPRRRLAAKRGEAEERRGGPCRAARLPHSSRRRLLVRAAPRPNLPPPYLISVSSLNIGRYMLMITMPTMTPTPSIMIGSTIEVSAWTEASTSSS